MFMKKRRYAELLAELHSEQEGSIVGAPTTPPHSDSERDSDIDHDDLIETKINRISEFEPKSKVSRVYGRPENSQYGFTFVEESDSILAKVNTCENIYVQVQYLLFLYTQHTL